MNQLRALLENIDGDAEVSAFDYINQDDYPVDEVRILLGTDGVRVVFA